MFLGTPDSARKTVQSGLLYYLDAGQLRSYPRSGTSWTNIYNSSWSGTLTNGPTFTSTNGGGIVFDGTDDYVLLGSPSVSVPASAITFSVWVKDNSYFLGRRGIMQTGNLKGGIFGPCMYYKAEAGVLAPGFVISMTSGTSYTVNGTVNRSYSTVYNFSGTYDGGTMRIYVNGVLDNSAAASGTIRQLGNHYLGPDGDSNYFACTIYAVLMYNRALSATELLQNYNVQKVRYGF